MKYEPLNSTVPLDGPESNNAPYHQIHPFSENFQLRRDGINFIKAAKGTHIFDGSDRAILDALSGLWCVNIGYGRKELADAAHRQMSILPYYNNFFKTANNPSAQLADVLSHKVPGRMKNVFFGTSGSDANDTIVNFVRLFWKTAGKPLKKTIIGRVNGYHGSTLAASSMGGMASMHEVADLPLPGFVHITQPYWFRLGRPVPENEFGLQSARALEDKILEIGADKVAAFVGEPIQGGGGVIIPPDTYWPEVQRICRRYDVLLIIDEVITGFGRTGRWFASEHYNLEPDFMTLAKGLTSGYIPLSAVMVGDRVAEVIVGKQGVRLQHGYTFSGHPVSCAVALENIRIIEEEDLVGNANQVSKHLLLGLKQLENSALVANTRLKGLLGAIELDERFRNPNTKAHLAFSKLFDFYFGIGLVVDVTDGLILFAPPLCWRHEDVDEFVGKIEKGLRFLAAEE